MLSWSNVFQQFFLFINSDGFKTQSSYSWSTKIILLPITVICSSRRFVETDSFDQYVILKAEYYTMMDQGPTESEFMHACKVFSDFRFSDNHIWLVSDFSIVIILVDRWGEVQHSESRRHHRFALRHHQEIRFSTEPSRCVIHSSK